MLLGSEVYGLGTLIRGKPVAKRDPNPPTLNQKGFGFRAKGSGSQVRGFGFRVSGLRFSLSFEVWFSWTFQFLLN